jgi:hypothetical protein
MGARASASEVWEKLPKWPPHKKFPEARGIYVDPALDLGQRLYRYMCADQAFRMLSTRALWFAAPHTWDDPHEKWWCGLLFCKGSHLGTAYAYGSCWTTRSHDEPFWRLYACSCPRVEPRRKSKVNGTDDSALPAVRFRVRTDVLRDWLLDATANANCKTFMGKVRYCSVSQLRDVASRYAASNSNPSHHAATALHLKRKAYEFESEVRMLWIDRKPRSKGRAIPIDPAHLFDQVMIGPSMKDARRRFAAVKARLIAGGIPEAIIAESSIGRVPRVNRRAGAKLHPEARDDAAGTAVSYAVESPLGPALAALTSGCMEGQPGRKPHQS